MTDRSLAHCVSVLCDAPAADAFAYLADAERIGEWALGCWDTRMGDDDVVRGTSLFDGTPSFVRVRSAAESRTVDFEVGGDPEHLVRRISARVVGGDDLEGDRRRSLVILLAWRTDSMDDDRWRRLIAAHDAEVLLLRERIERSAAG
jgi:hypothetical protein